MRNPDDETQMECSGSEATTPMECTGSEATTPMECTGSENDVVMMDSRNILAAPRRLRYEMVT
jgi:hypothetical protein